LNLHKIVTDGHDSVTLVFGRIKDVDVSSTHQLTEGRRQVAVGDSRLNPGTDPSAASVSS
jgi:hypothetical protein